MKLFILIAVLAVAGLVSAYAGVKSESMEGFLFLAGGSALMVVGGTVGLLGAFGLLDLN